LIIEHHYWNDRAVKYRHDSSIEHLDTELTAAGIAVLVQMVNADITGVTSQLILLMKVVILLLSPHGGLVNLLLLE